MAFGLLDQTSKKEVALKHIRVRARISGYTASVKSTLEYTNNCSSPIEAVFVFPVDDLSAVCSFSAIIDGRRVVGQLKEKEEARLDYDDAIASGRSAFLAEEKTGDIFRISVGNLPAGGEAKVELGYVSELRTEADGGARFNLPTVLTPRYVAESSSGNLAEESATSEAALTAPSAIPYSLDLEAIVSGEGYSSLPTVTSPSYKLDVRCCGEEGGGRDQVVRLANNYDFRSDIVLIVHPAEGDQNKAFAVVEGGSDVTSTACKDSVSMMDGPMVAVNFTPDFPDKSRMCELLFVVDRSGSMQGNYIKAASEALSLFLRSIPTGCRFNVIGFGSRYTSLFKGSVEYNQKSLNTASKHASSLAADLGGTELTSPLQFIFSQPLVKGYPRQVFVLTDGSVSNTQMVIDLVERNAEHTRCFAVGIGSGASTHLVEGIAHAGKGTAEFVLENERLQSKVMRMLKQALQPAIDSVSIEWKIPSCKVVQVPKNLPNVFAGSRLVAFGFPVDQSGSTSEECVSCKAILHYRQGSEKFSLPIGFSLPPAKKSTDEEVDIYPVHRLAGKQMLKEISHQGNKDELVRVSLQTSVVCKETAFVAVDEEASEAVQGALTRQTILVPTRHLDTYSTSRSFSSRRAYCSAALMPASAQLCAYSAPKSSNDNSIAEVHAIMKQNIDQLLQRDERLNELEDRSDSLTTNSALFMKNASSVRRKMSLGGRISSALSSAGEWVSGLFSSSSDQQSCAAVSSGAVSSSEGASAFDSSSQVLSKEEEEEEEGEEEKKEEAVAHGDHLSIVSLQQASGAWQLNDALAKVCGLSLASMKSSMPVSVQGVSEKDLVWATLLAITVLSKRHSEVKDEWELVVDKAMDWLKVSAASADKGIDELLECAKAVL